jgi:hypothetical protein
MQLNPSYLMAILQLVESSAQVHQMILPDLSVSNYLV